jgi:hypothetical protein
MNWRLAEFLAAVLDARPGTVERRNLLMIPRRENIKAHIGARSADGNVQTEDGHFGNDRADGERTRQVRTSRVGMGSPGKGRRARSRMSSCSCSKCQCRVALASARRRSTTSPSLSPSATWARTRTRSASRSYLVDSDRTADCDPHPHHAFCFHGRGSVPSATERVVLWMGTSIGQYFHLRRGHQTTRAGQMRADVAVEPACQPAQ